MKRKKHKTHKKVKKKTGTKKEKNKWMLAISGMLILVFSFAILGFFTEKYGTINTPLFLILNVASILGIILIIVGIIKARKKE